MLVECSPRECRSKRGGVGCDECCPIRVFKAVFHQRRERSRRGTRDRQWCLIDEVVEERFERHGCQLAMIDSDARSR